MIVLIGSQKGGCGKSTTAVNLCASLADAGRDLILVDADRQGTASNWASDRAEQTDIPLVNCVQKYGNISSTLKDLDGRYEYVIVDAAARDSRELRTGMVVADILVVPFRPSQPDLDTLVAVHKLVNQAGDLNADLSAYAVLTMASTNPLVNEVAEATEYLVDYPDIHLMETVIRDRKVYRDAVSEGLGVIEMSNAKAKDEISSFVKELLDG